MNERLSGSQNGSLSNSSTGCLGHPHSTARPGMETQRSTHYQFLKPRSHSQKTVLADSRSHCTSASAAAWATWSMWRCARPSSTAWKACCPSTAPSAPCASPPAARCPASRPAAPTVAATAACHVGVITSRTRHSPQQMPAVSRVSSRPSAALSAGVPVRLRLRVLPRGSRALRRPGRRRSAVLAAAIQREVMVLHREALRRQV